MAEALLANPLVGRQRQLDSVRRWVADLASGRGRAVLVEGEPGIGKSYLIHAAVKEAETAGCRTLWAACDELSQAFPLLPLLDALDPDTTSAVTETLRADSAPGNKVDQVAAATERLLALVDELCTTAPVMLVVDDLQWADSATVVALGRLARSVRQLPLLVVGMNRPVPHREDLIALRRAIEPTDLLRLRSLSSAEAKDLVAEAVGGTPGPRLLLLAADAAGNPLYLTELIDALHRSNALTIEDGCVEAANGGRTPESLTAAIADRLEFLSTPVRGVLRAAALLGVDFSVSELAVVSGRSVNDLLPTLDEAILAGVLRDDGPGLAFRHPLIQAALYDGMPRAVRAAWHLDAGKALAKSGASVEKVARQLLPAIDAHDEPSAADEWVVRWLVDVGQQLVSQAADAAAPLLRWAVNGATAAVAPYDLLICRLGGALYKMGDADDAARVAAEALPYVTRPDLLVDLHWTLAMCRAMEGRSEESFAVLEQALSAPGLEARHRARLLVLSARTHRSLGRVDTAGRVAEKALAEATAAGDNWAIGWALGVLVLVHEMRGESGQALPLLRRALAVAKGHPGLADLQLMLQINQAAVLGDIDRYDEAIPAAEQVRQQSDDAGNIVRLAQAQSVLGELLFDVGRWDDALGEIDVESGGSKDPTVECGDHGMAATIQFHRGDDSATQHLTEAERYAARIGGRVLGPLLLARSLDREQADKPAEALGALMEGLAETAEEAEETADLLADAVRLAIKVGDEAAASNVVDRAETMAKGSEVPHRQAVAAHCRGLLERDAVLLLQAADLYKAAGRPLPRAQALEAAGVALADRGDVTGARTHFTEAFSIYTDLGARWDLARTQAIFRAYGIRRGPHARHRRSQQGWESLTPTEMKVVELVARGMSNPEIAAHLFLSRRTVQTHVSHILTKLDLHSRIDIAREASRRDLRPRPEGDVPSGL